MLTKEELEILFKEPVTVERDHDMIAIIETNGNARRPTEDEMMEIIADDSGEAFGRFDRTTSEKVQ